MVMVDANRILQVLANFLSNAAKFSPAETTVNIGMAVDGKNVRVSVTDHGPGVPDEAKERISDLRRVLERNPEECRVLLKLVLDGPVTFKPIELSEGPRYEVHARASLKKILAAAAGWPRFTKAVSPAGVEP